MTHPDEGALQAFLDDELPPGERSELAEHLLTCRTCQATHDELARANALFARSVSALDAEPPRGGEIRVVRSGAKAGTSWFLKAAALILFLAAASAAVPGSPVRAWLGRAVDPPPDPAVVDAPAPAPADPAPASPAALPVGLSLGPADGRVVVALDRPGSALRLEAVEGTRAGVSVVGGREPVFRTRSGRIEVRELDGASVRVRLPLGVPVGRLEVGGRLYAEQAEGRLRVLVPADTVDGALVWR